MTIINIATDFHDTPGARYLTQGTYTGDKFYDTLLKSKYQEALSKNEKLTVNLDDTYGYPPSFLSESFGRLYKDFGKEKIWENIIFISNDDDYLVDKIHYKAETYGSEE